MEMIEYGGVIPERENLPYYLISIRWFTRWQKYTGCFKVEDDEEENDRGSSKVILGEYPGEINSDREMRDLCVRVNEKTIVPEEDFYCNYYLQAGKKENQDYRVVDYEVWNKLYSKYGGNEVPRKSIAVPTDNPTRPDYIVEVQLRRFKILTWPKVKYFPQSLSQEVFCSRTDTVKELICRITSSEMYQQISQKPGEELATYCRLWKIEGDDTFQDIKDALDGANMPNEVQGRILDPHMYV